jgi:16S rRNA (cytosine967-C5)-methyltransferase
MCCERQGFKVQNGRYSDAALVVEDGAGIFETAAYREGLFYVQDESSMLAVEVLDPKPGRLMVDVCSAPGGKSQIK